MKKKYFIMTLNEETGCPVGFYYSVLEKNLEGMKGDYGTFLGMQGPRDTVEHFLHFRMS